MPASVTDQRTSFERIDCRGVVPMGKVGIVSDHLHEGADGSWAIAGGTTSYD